MSQLTGIEQDQTGEMKVMILWCNNDVNGTIGTYPYRKVSDEIQRILHEHDHDDVRVYRLEEARISFASGPRHLPDGDVVWLNREVPAPAEQTECLFSLNYKHQLGEELFRDICAYLASVPNTDGRWEVKVVDDDIDTYWRVSANEHTYEFLAAHWNLIPDADPMFLSECAADEVKAWLLRAYDWTQRAKNAAPIENDTTREKWLYLEEGNVVQSFSVKSELAQYIYISDNPKDGHVKLVIEHDLLGQDFPTAVNEPASEFLARYEQHYPLFPPRDRDAQTRIRETRYILDGKECTASDLWERSFKPQIDKLMRSDADNHIAALVLMLPPMDLVYKLKTGKTKSRWKEILEMFFPADGFEEDAYRQLSNLIRNGFVHDGFTKGNVGISPAHHTPEEYSDMQQVFQGYRTETGQFKLLIIPAFFWARVRNKIDSFYQYEQWIPGWDMHMVVTLSPHVPRITTEEIVGKAQT